MSVRVSEQKVSEHERGASERERESESERERGREEERKRDVLLCLLKFLSKLCVLCTDHAVFGQLGTPSARTSSKPSTTSSRLSVNRICESAQVLPGSSSGGEEAEFGGQATSETKPRPSKKVTNARSRPGHPGLATPWVTLHCSDDQRTTLRKETENLRKPRPDKNLGLRSRGRKLPSNDRQPRSRNASRRKSSRALQHDGCRHGGPAERQRMLLQELHMMRDYINQMANPDPEPEKADHTLKKQREDPCDFRCKEEAQRQKNARVLFRKERRRA